MIVITKEAKKRAEEGNTEMQNDCPTQGVKKESQLGKYTNKKKAGEENTQLDNYKCLPSSRSQKRELERLEWKKKKMHMHKILGGKVRW